ncbi:MAG: hypothetical protein R3F61_11965 [Myxococcota bacterium]
MIALVAVAFADGPACPAVPPLLDAANGALVEVETDAAQQSMRKAEEALLACRAIFDPKTLGRLWLLEGVLRTVEGDETAATDAFAASGRVAPDAWQDVYGPTVRGRYEVALTRDPGASDLELVPELGANVAWLDGVRAEGSTVPTTGGLHAVQISDPTGVVLFSQILWLPPGDRMRLETGVPTASRVEVEVPGPVPRPEPVVAREPKRIDPLLVGGIGAAVVGGTLMAWSFERSAAMGSATEPDVLRSRYHQHAASRISGLGMLGLGVTAVGLSFTF